MQAIQLALKSTKDIKYKVEGANKDTYVVNVVDMGVDDQPFPLTVGPIGVATTPGISTTCQRVVTTRL